SLREEGARFEVPDAGPGHIEESALETAQVGAEARFPYLAEQNIIRTAHVDARVQGRIDAQRRPNRPEIALQRRERRAQRRRHAERTQKRIVLADLERGDLDSAQTLLLLLPLRFLAGAARLPLLLPLALQQFAGLGVRVDAAAADERGVRGAEQGAHLLHPSHRTLGEQPR